MLQDEVFFLPQTLQEKLNVRIRIPDRHFFSNAVEYKEKTGSNDAIIEN